MTRLWGLALVLTSILAAACTAPAPAQPQANAPADLQSIETLRNAFASAYMAGNADAIGALYTDDAVTQTNMQATATGRPAIIEQLKGTFSQFNLKMDITPEETHTLGNSGWERGRYTMSMSPKAGGAPMAMDGRYMILLEKGADGSWKLSRDMDNTATPPAPPAASEPAK